MSLTSRLALPDVVAPEAEHSAPGLLSRIKDAYVRWQKRRVELYVRDQLMQLRPSRLVELGYAPTEVADLMLAHRVPDHRIM